MLINALNAWRSVLGPEYVITDAELRSELQTATFLTTQKIPAILRPANRVEVQECVRIANTYKTPIYPISRGKNWGYGSQVPVQDGCVILDLQRLNRIVEYDERLAYITVEPGVTMRQLYEFLQQKKANLLMSMTGSTVESSLIGNVIERGLGSGRYADRFGHVCGFEVILPTGECIHTGFDRFPSAQTGHVSRWSVGPYLDGLFTQSNFGIVTQMTIWLMPRPEYTCICLFTLKDDAHLETLVDALYTLKFEGGYATPIYLYNDYKLLSMAMQYPLQITADQLFLTPDIMKSVRSALGLGAWNGLTTLHYANERLGNTMREFIQDVLSNKVNSLRFIDGGQITQQTTASVASSLIDLEKIMSNLDILNDSSIRSTYWRKKGAPPSPMDPDRDRCGLIWCAPLVPFTGSHVRAAREIIEQVCIAYQLEPHLTLAFLTERSVIITLALLYDREIPGEDERAMACYNELLQRLIEKGYFPYRLGIQSMHSLPETIDDYDRVLSRLKNALDPNGILAPGRYDFQPQC